MQDITNGRCGWCGTDELYVKYHDEEWGKTVTDDKTLFEFLVLESAQAGLSWITILKKREGYRKAFCNFDAAQVAQMTDIGLCHFLIISFFVWAILWAMSGKLIRVFRSCYSFIVPTG